MRKGLLVFTFSTLLSSVGCAQLEKKTWLAGGYGNYSSDKQILPNGNVAVKTAYLSIMPNLGYFILDKFAVGINVGVVYSKNFAASSGGSEPTYKAGPFARYYFLKKDQRLNLFLDGTYNYTNTTIKNFGSVGTLSSSSYSLRGGPEFFFNSSVGLKFTLGWYSDRYQDKSRNNSFQIGLGFQIHLQNKSPTNQTL